MLRFITTVAVSTMRTNTLLAVGAVLAAWIAAPARADDLDEDGIDDGVEQLLIDMYRPLLRYGLFETIRPCTAEQFVRNSRLIRGEGGPTIFTFEQVANNPLLILQAPSPPSTTALQPANMDYRIDLAFGFRHGPPGPIQAIGMYGHVVPLTAPASYTNGPTLPLPPHDFRDYYLLQYWQLFPYNDFPGPPCGGCNIGDHEGDWIWIDLFVRKTCPYGLEYIVYHHHGDNDCAPTVVHPPSFPSPSRPFPLPCNPAHVAVVPECYLEEGSHEWWPGPSGGCDSFGGHNPPHLGDGVVIESQNVINLGERYAPMSGLEPHLILHFNGFWGDDHGFLAGPSGGPLRQISPGYTLPPLMVAYVNSAAGPWIGEGLGSRYYPFVTVSSAVSGATPVETGGRVLIAPGSYPGPHTFTRSMTLERNGPGGPVVIGQ